ncbi:MAG: hypothetical protein AB7T37_06275 [Dehalococcoidia bacterium]
MAIDGTWNLTMTTPMGERPVKARFAATGADLAGAVIGDAGERAFETGSVSGDDVAWVVTVPTAMGDMRLEFAGAVAGDAISGKVKLGAFGEAPFRGSREE